LEVAQVLREIRPEELEALEAVLAGLVVLELRRRGPRALGHPRTGGRLLSESLSRYAQRKASRSSKEKTGQKSDQP